MSFQRSFQRSKISTSESECSTFNCGNGWFLLLFDVDTVEEEAANTDRISAREETEGDFLEHNIIFTFLGGYLT